MRASYERLHAPSNRCQTCDKVVVQIRTLKNLENFSARRTEFPKVDGVELQKTALVEEQTVQHMYSDWMFYCILQGKRCTIIYPDYAV